MREGFLQRIAGECPAIRSVGLYGEMRTRDTSGAVGSGSEKVKGLVDASGLLNVVAYCVTEACLVSTQIENDNGEFLALKFDAAA